jgi:hypothetical protein
VLFIIRQKKRSKIKKEIITIKKEVKSKRKSRAPQKKK